MSSTENYNMERYLEKIILENNEALIQHKIANVKIKRMNNKARALYKIGVDYSSDNCHLTNFFIAKRIHNAKQTFDILKGLEISYSRDEIEFIFPHVYFFDNETNYIIMECFPASSFLKKTILSLSGRSYGNLLDTFLKIGGSLALFHKVSWENSYISFKELIAELLKHSAQKQYFDKNELELIKKKISEGGSILRTGLEIPVCRLYNDWTLRNVLVHHMGNIKLIDPDSMVHPAFSEFGVIFNDISTFIINVESLSRFSPLIDTRHLKHLNRAFVEGYMSKSVWKFSHQEINFLHYITTLKLYIGIRSRPLNQVYHGRLSNRYMIRLRKQLIQGDVEIF